MLFLVLTGLATAQDAGVPAGDAVPNGTLSMEPLPDERDMLLPEEDGNRLENPDGFSSFGILDFLRMILVLGAVIAVIYGIFFLLRRVSLPRFQEDGLIRVLTTQPLTGGRFLHLVQVGRQVFLIGSGEGNVNMLSEISDRESIDEIALSTTSSIPAGGQGGFARMLSDLFRSGRGSGSGPGSIPDLQDPASLDFLRQQQERLKKLR